MSVLHTSALLFGVAMSADGKVAHYVRAALPAMDDDDIQKFGTWISKRIPGSFVVGRPSGTLYTEAAHIDAVEKALFTFFGRHLDITEVTSREYDIAMDSFEAAQIVRALRKPLVSSSSPKKSRRFIPSIRRCCQTVVAATTAVHSSRRH